MASPTRSVPVSPCRTSLGRALCNQVAHDLVACKQGAHTICNTLQLFALCNRTGSRMYPCVLFALRREAQPFYRHFDVRRRLTAAPCPAWLCGTSLGRVLVLESGVGPERCGRALRWLTESYLPGQNLLQPLFLVSAGFAGALHDECSV